MSNTVLTITCEDCMALMARYPDKYFDIAIVDPPYGNYTNLSQQGKYRIEHTGHSRTGKSGNYNWRDKYDIKHKIWDKAPEKEYFEELFRVSKQQIIWGGNYFSDKLPPSNNFIIWKKLRISETFSMAMCEYAWTNIRGNAKIFEFPPQDRTRFHPTQKPVALYKWILSMYAHKGDKVLDTHIGSGSIAIACDEMRYNLTTCEIDVDYYAQTMARIKEYQKQQQFDWDWGGNV